MLPNNNTVFVYKTVCCPLTCPAWSATLRAETRESSCITCWMILTFASTARETRHFSRIIINIPNQSKIFIHLLYPFSDFLWYYLFSEKCVMFYECSCLGNEILRLEISVVLTDKPFLKSSLCVWAHHANSWLTTYKMEIWALI